MAMVVRQPPVHPPMAATSAVTSRALPRWRRFRHRAFNHFFRRGPSFGGDLLYIQGPQHPGIYAAPSSEAASARTVARKFRQSRRQGISSPLPASQADARFLAVLDRVDGPRAADLIYQARFLKYLHRPRHRHRPAQGVVFCGDGEMDEPAWARSLAGREHLDNLDLRRQLQSSSAWTARCAATASKIIQELEGVFAARLERHQRCSGAATGTAAGARQGRPAAQAHDGHRRRRLPGDEGQRRRLRARELLRQAAELRDGRQDERRRTSGA